MITSTLPWWQFPALTAMLFLLVAQVGIVAIQLGRVVSALRAEQEFDLPPSEIPPETIDQLAALPARWRGEGLPGCSAAADALEEVLRRGHER
jgi:hypothetical protein